MNLRTNIPQSQAQSGKCDLLATINLYKEPIKSMKKKYLSIILMVLAISIWSKERAVIEIVSVTHNGFSIDPNKSTELTIKVKITDFQSNDNDWKIKISPGNNAKWNNNFSNWTQASITHIEGSIYTIKRVSGSSFYLKTNTNEPFLDILNIGFKENDWFDDDTDYYKLKVVADKAYNELNLVQQQYLAEKFLPILKLDGGYHSNLFGPESFYPKEVDILLNNPTRNTTIFNREFINEYVAQASKNNLAIYNESFTLTGWPVSYPANGNFINFRLPNGNNNGDEPNSYDMLQFFNNYADQFNTQLYASFCEENGKTILTYWFYYLYNLDEDENNRTYNYHISDWEGMSIVFDSLNQANYQSLMPIAAATSSHLKSGKRRDWVDIEKIDLHPVVYVCNSSHATYFTSGSTENEGGLFSSYDYHYGDGMWIVPQYFDSDLNSGNIEKFGYKGSYATGKQVEILPRLDSINADELENYWHSFGGNWGQSSNNQQGRGVQSTSPSSPPFIESKDLWDNTTDGFKWFRPYTWFIDQTRENIANNSPIAFYSLNDDSIDESGNGYNGTSFNITPCSDRFGISNKACYFNGEDSHIIIDSSNKIISENNTWTIGCWIKLNDEYSIKTIYSEANNIDSYAIDFSINGNTLSAAYNGAVENINISSIDLEQDKWYSVFWVKGVNNSKIYVDGFYEEFINSSEYVESFSSIYPTIGKKSYMDIGYFNGKIDNLRLYNRALSNQEIMNIYNEEKTTPQIEVTPINIDVNVIEGTIVNYDFTVDNIGDGELYYNLTTTSDWISLSKQTGHIFPSEDTETISIQFDASEIIPDEYLFDLIISSNSVLDSLISVPMFVTVSKLSSPDQVTISKENETIIISWTAVEGATGYKIFSSSNPYYGFEEDVSGTLNCTSWVSQFSNNKRFFYVKAVN